MTAGARTGLLRYLLYSCIAHIVENALESLAAAVVRSADGYFSVQELSGPASRTGLGQDAHAWFCCQLSTSGFRCGMCGSSAGAGLFQAQGLLSCGGAQWLVNPAVN